MKHPIDLFFTIFWVNIFSIRIRPFGGLSKYFEFCLLFKLSISQDPFFLFCWFLTNLPIHRFSRWYHEFLDHFRLEKYLVFRHHLHRRDHRHHRHQHLPHFLKIIKFQYFNLLIIHFSIIVILIFYFHLFSFVFFMFSKIVLMNFLSFGIIISVDIFFKCLHLFG